MILKLALLLVLLGCYGGSPNMLTVLLNPVQLSNKLDPKSIQYTHEFQILENLVSRLITLDENGIYQLDLASQFEEVSPTEYMVQIKERHFSNGEVITSEDVRQSLTRSLKDGSSHIEFRNILDKIEIVDSKKLKIILKKPSKSFHYYFSLPDTGVLHSSQYKKDVLLAQDFIKVSSGPYLYSEKDGEYFLKKNINFKSTNNYPDLIKLESFFDSDPAQKVIAGKAQLGSLSIDSYLRNKDILDKNENLKVIGVPSSSLTYIYYNPYSKNKRSIQTRKWIKAYILDKLKIPAEYSSLARKSIQYFPPESKAYIPENNLSIDEISSSSKPKDAPTDLEIHTYTTAFKVTLEPVLRQLELLQNLKVKIVADIKPGEYEQARRDGRFEYFINIMSTDFRAPVEAIGFEFFSEYGPFVDSDNIVRTAFDNYQLATSNIEENQELQKISRFIFKGEQVIPLFHSVTPFIYDLTKVDVSGLNHLFLYNFWKLKIR
jgi:ABC-type transport system substrate-binding protein